ncbi:MAG: hypothetical protein RLZZ241_1086 [Bacteroidota bacterium]|jgi:sugar (pentulose or hexulose) kinase
MATPVTAIFDIGKTNKKCFLFDRQYREVYREFASFDLIADEDGHPTEDLEALTLWVKGTFNRLFADPKWNIEILNFSTYGASLVHLDQNGRPAAPLYNYTKLYPTDLEAQFYAQFGPESEFGRATGTTRSGMLNSGMQLYWLKHNKPELFKKIAVSLHLPQYLSYCFTGKAVSDFTSIGCHTGLWDYRENKYHDWLRQEGLIALLPTPISTDTQLSIAYQGKELKVGIGIHDSSAALYPYLKSTNQPFALLSTGTWSVAMNPFSDGLLTANDQDYDCINYMQPDGSAVKAGRLFLGNEFGIQLGHIAECFNVSESELREIPFDEALYIKLQKKEACFFKWESLQPIDLEISPWNFASPEEAYHQLNYELCVLQVRSLRHVIGKAPIENVYLDGGFTSNLVFVEILSRLIHPLKLILADAAQGTALGAAVVLSKNELPTNFLQTQYHLKNSLNS